MCRSMVDIPSTAAEIRRGKKRRRRKERNYRAKIYMVSLLHRATIKYSDKLSCNSVWKFLRKVANKQTDKQTNDDGNIASLAEVIIFCLQPAGESTGYQHGP